MDSPISTHVRGDLILISVVDANEDDFSETINCSDNMDETEDDYETGSFTCQWELGRFSDGGDASVQRPICGAYFERRTQFVEHCRTHLDK